MGGTQPKRGHRAPVINLDEELKRAAPGLGNPSGRVALTGRAIPTTL